MPSDIAPLPRTGMPVLATPTRMVLRHADAGNRATATEPDAWRALSISGWLQAHAVRGRLGGRPVVRIFASPALRCRQTVVPLARSLGLDVEPRAELAQDAPAERVRRFLDDPETAGAVLCTHRETLERLFALLDRDGGAAGRPVEGVAPMAKAALWALDPRAPGQVRYLSPGSP
jgi:phosphohistidine phosphatase SixA